ncbi:accessory factor UbiK family protein [Endozoicomonas sp. SM1973]|uniref:Ubiquinone biosynthesis accessory factor UbiK n=1 Tax=Spartinivicinus marinus TaxID=2994442 RepID=A0A853IA62_9GAMM|nr:accessory factor UbiK family protein [Spartinivicinus marinus]MCX4027387.1 accessory factor UbiK family protein [Spartinivicinus marinus]NYZ66437.1 accessory factor UbiK family protein [Spartinivicinus marinus]
MINKTFIQSLSEQIGQNISNKAQSLLQGDKSQIQTELEGHVKLLLQSTFNKLDLVTRDEFDTQTAVLHRTREKLELLTKQVALMEQALASAESEDKKQTNEDAKDKTL